MPPCATSLPAAATTTTLWLSAYSTAFRRAGTSSGVASDRLMTSAPNRTASMIPCGVTEVGKVSVPLIFTDRIRAAGATPVNETPATGAAAMMLATAVPWPTQSAPGGMPSLVPATRSGPGITRSPNCGFASTPLSTTATVTPPPLVRFQTEAKPSSRCAHGAAAGATTPGCGGQPGRGPGRPSCARGAAWTAGPVSRSAAAQTARASPPRRATPTSATPGLYIHKYGADPGPAHDDGNCYQLLSRRDPNRRAHGYVPIGGDIFHRKGALLK